MRRSFRTKITVSFTVLTLLLATVIGFAAVKNMEKEVENLAFKKLDTDVSLINYTFEFQYPGEWAVKMNTALGRDTLFKGYNSMYNNSLLIDKISQLTEGNKVSLYQGDEIIATNIHDKQGKRIVGMKLEDPSIRKKVLEEGKTYTGKTYIGNEEYLCKYLPLRDSKSQVLGMIFIGMPIKAFAQSAQRFLVKLFLWGLGGILVSFIISYFISGSFVGPVWRLRSVVGRAATGDLTVKAHISTRDELGDLGRDFDNMLGKLREFMEGVNSAVQKVADYSKMLSSASQESSASSQQMAASVQEMAEKTSIQSDSTSESKNLIEDVSRKINQAASKAEVVRDNSQRIKDNTDKGIKIVEQLKERNESSNRSIKEIREVFELLESSTRSIDRFISNIDEIAEQTNLLALNAAIEAARAGESGRGFAVVAEEVRKLADDSMRVTAEIKEIVKGIENNVENVKKALDTSHEIATLQNAAVQDTISFFQSIANDILNITQSIQDISGSLEEMSISKDGVVEKINQVSSLAENLASSAQQIAAVTQQQSASAQQVASAASHLDRLVNELEEGLSTYKLE